MNRAIKRLLNHIPTKLPQGMTEFETWANDIIDTYEMPSNDSVKFAIAVAILHLKSDEGSKPKAYFGNILLKGAASQIAQAIMQDCKARQEELIKKQAEEANKPVEVTTSPDAVASHEPIQV